MKHCLPSLALALTLAATVCSHAQEAPAPVKQVPMLSPQEELKTIQLPEGYKLELVLSEPEIKEPNLCVFDGNGRMYVAEMRTYMQDIDGNNELVPQNRISRHESTKGDGVFDKHSVYLDKIMLPRMILPLDDRVLVNVTNTNDITINRDSKRDGVANEISTWYSGGPRGGNLEHQPSGLVWGLDNWLYTTYNSYRLRWNGAGKPASQEPTASNGGQWGLAQDDYGKMWFSNAGGEKGIWNFQTPIVYASINVSSQKPADFDEVWPLVGLADVQGGEHRFRPEDKTLNHFTASCGQTVFRGDRLPKELYGNVFLPEPVGRLIRRATVEVKDGITMVSNPYGHSEFIRSTDPNFRPINMTTGPDGCIYIVDVYRGIIQEGNWVKEGSFLRGKVKENGFENNIGHGRIWRLTHKDFKPGPQPHMLDETPAQLVTHLEHPNGWWRDTAQRMLIVKGDKSVVPALKQMMEKSKNHLARIHALWTLEGLDALTPEMVHAPLHDENAMVRVCAIRAAETLVKKGNKDLIAEIKTLAQDSDPNVVLQVVMTSKLLNWPDWKKEAQARIFTSPSAGVHEIGGQLLIEAPRIVGKFTKDQKKQLDNGQEIFRSLCFACHGFDGKGMPMPGREGMTLAPPLAGSQTVVRGDSVLRVLLHGLSGPINGKTYEAQMVTMGTNTDQWLADVASYVRKAFGNQGGFVSKDDVKKLRATYKTRTAPWTIEELNKNYPQPLENHADWKLTASHKPQDCGKAVDGDPLSRWTTGYFQRPGAWFQVELPAETEIAGLVLDTTKSANDYPRKYTVDLSKDGEKWEKAVLKGEGSSAITELTFSKPVKTKFIRINQNGEAKGNYWSIHELQVLKPAAAGPTKVAEAK
jgi:putative membrane-bound dehydrogenase-like protein